MNPSNSTTGDLSSHRTLAWVLVACLVAGTAGALGTWWVMHATAPPRSPDEAAAPQPSDPNAHKDEGAATVHLSKAAAERAGIILQPVRSAVLPEGAEMPGEVQFDPTRVAHLTPIISGIAREVRKNLGDHVDAGEVLAVIDSLEYGLAKSEYLEKQQVLLVAQADHERTASVHENTKKLLERLAAEPPASEAESKTSDLRIGEAKGRLLMAYATRQAARLALARERDASARNLATQAELQEAMKNSESAEADYRSAAESIALADESAFLGSQSRLRIADAAVKVGERRLAMLGIAHEELQHLGEAPASAMSLYELKSPIAGFIVAKHMTTGERVSSDTDPFVVVDISTVWINAAAREGDLAFPEGGSGGRSGVVGVSQGSRGRPDRRGRKRPRRAHEDREREPRGREQGRPAQARNVRTRDRRGVRGRSPCESHRGCRSRADRWRTRRRLRRSARGTGFPRDEFTADFDAG